MFGSDHIKARVTWLVGASPKPEDDESTQLEYEHSRLTALADTLRKENASLHTQLEATARQLDAHHADSEADKYEEETAALAAAHKEALERFDNEHEQRMDAEKKRNTAIIDLQKAELQAQHMKNEVASMEQRTNMALRAAQDAGEMGLKIEMEKDEIIQVIEKQAMELQSKLDQLKLDSLSLKRELATCSSRALEAHSNLRTIQDYSRDVVRDVDRDV
jgi:chromosome segregation ATPase